LTRVKSRRQILASAARVCSKKKKFCHKPQTRQWHRMDVRKNSEGEKKKYRVWKKTMIWLL